MAEMGARVRRALVEADAGHAARDVRGEPDAEFDGVRIDDRRIRRHGGWAEDVARTRRDDGGRSGRERPARAGRECVAGRVLGARIRGSAMDRERVDGLARERRRGRHDRRARTGVIDDGGAHQRIGGVAQLERTAADRRGAHRLVEGHRRLHRDAHADRGARGRGRAHLRRRRVGAVGRDVGARGRGEERVLHALDARHGERDRRAVALDAAQYARAHARRQHPVQPVGCGVMRHREGQRAAVPGLRSEGRGIARVEPGEHLPPGDDRYAVRLRGGDGGGRLLGSGDVGVGVDRVDAVEALAADRAVKQRVDRERVGLPRFVGHLRRGHVDVDVGAVEIGETHRHRRTREQTRHVVDPARWPEVVRRVEPQAVAQFDCRARGPVAPDDAVVALAHGGRQARELRLPVGHLGRVERRQRGWREVQAVRVQMQADFEAERVVLRRLRVGHRRARIDVGRAADAFPVGDRASGRAVRDELVEPPGGAAVAVVVTRHEDSGLLAVRQVPEPGQRLRIHALDEIGQQALLFVGLRDRDLVQVDPVRLRIRGGRAEELVVGADRREAVALLGRPRGIALPGVDHRLREVERERRGLAETRRIERDRRIGGGDRRRAVERREPCRAVGREQAGRAVELHRVAHDAVAGGSRGIDLQVAGRERRAGRSDAEHTGERSVRRHHDQVAARVHPVRQQRDLAGGHRHLGDDDDVVARQQRGRERGDVGDRELVEAFGTQDFGVVGRERRGTRGDDQDGPARSHGRIGRGARHRRQRRGTQEGDPRQKQPDQAHLPLKHLVQHLRSSIFFLLRHLPRTAGSLIQIKLTASLPRYRAD